MILWKLSDAGSWTGCILQTGAGPSRPGWKSHNDSLPPQGINKKRSISAWMEEIQLFPPSYLVVVELEIVAVGVMSPRPKLQVAGLLAPRPVAVSHPLAQHLQPVIGSLFPLTLCETGKIHRMLPLEWMWALVLALLGSAARIPWSRSCLLYSEMSGFQRSAGLILGQHSFIAFCLSPENLDPIMILRVPRQPKVSPDQPEPNSGSENPVGVEVHPLGRHSQVHHQWIAVTAMLGEWRKTWKYWAGRSHYLLWNDKLVIIMEDCLPQHWQWTVICPGEE